MPSVAQGKAGPGKAGKATAAAASKGKRPASAPKVDDFVMTLDSDSEPDADGLEEEALESENDSDDEEQGGGKKKKTARLSTRDKVIGSAPPKAGASKTGGEEEFLIDKDFQFGADDDQDLDGGFSGWDFGQKNQTTGVEDIIKRRREEKELPDVEVESEEEDDEEEEDEYEVEVEDDGDDSDPDEFGGGIRKKAEAGEASDDDDAEEDDDDEEDDEEESAEAEDGEDDSSESEDDKETEVEKARKAAYFASDSTNATSTGAADKQANDAKTTFDSLGLSRPLLRALTALSFHTPTPIQKATIPHAMAGRDIVANAVTGSGKTAAFLIPILERLAHRPRAKGDARSSVLILTPTRELAVQCCAVGKAIAKNMDLRFCLCVGGLSLKAQETELKLRPEVIIATPGRLIDHVRNSASFGLEDLQILVLDEADRMLEEGFAAELGEIISATPKGRQTMLFSATMTDDIDELVRLSLKRPVRLFVDPKRSTSKKLIQEFVRVRGAAAAGEAEGEASSGKRTEEETRPALLLSLCTRTFRHQVIIFVRSKKLAHQLRILFGLLGLSAAELHGDLTQEQRLNSLQSFKDGRTDFLIATDLASRGLDIKGVQTVINYDMPAQFEQYLHRVGRTARAGRNGRAVTLVGEADRRLLKTALKRTPSSQVKHRLVPSDAVSSMIAHIASLKPEVDAVLKEEKEQKLLNQAEMEVRKGQNILEHQDEIMSRPKRTWFQSEKDKLEAKNLSKAEYAAKVDVAKAAEKRKAESAKGRDRYAGLSRKQKRAKQAREEDEAERKEGKLNASIRAAKKASQPKELGVVESKKRPSSASGKKQRSSTSAAKVGKKGSGFARDLGEKGGARGGGGGGALKAKKGPPPGKAKGAKAKGGKGGRR